MIEIAIRKRSEHIREVRVKGHGGGVRGEDIVCAAVSAITQTALSGLLFYGKDDVRWGMEKGTLWMNISERVKRENQEVFHIILSTMIIGLKKIAQEYPDRVVIYMDETEKV